MHAPLPLLSHICTQTTPPHSSWPMATSTQTESSLRAPARPGLWKRLQPLRKGTSASSAENRREADYYLLSFICVYRGWGSGSWSLTSKLAPGSWKGHGHHQGQPEHTSRTGPSLDSPRQGWLPPSPTSSHNCLPSPGGSSRCHRPEWRPRCHAPCSPGPRPPSRSGPAG